ncbi:hypothetical protein NDU88_003629 [Pleurodeles waltl]|uniref:Uncharacterized protein n=1 Tax=Pleurodeles waltl TaxID=8319 RepID=A0AAV7MS62_PLEWA|nr:hypothetical protein NDU88_003629 [Pleurodeles waltl]
MKVHLRSAKCGTAHRISSVDQVSDPGLHVLVKFMCSMEETVNFSFQVYNFVFHHGHTTLRSPHTGDSTFQILAKQAYINPYFSNLILYCHLGSMYCV